MEHAKLVRITDVHPMVHEANKLLRGREAIRGLWGEVGQLADKLGIDRNKWESDELDRWRAVAEDFVVDAWSEAVGHVGAGGKPIPEAARATIREWVRSRATSPGDTQLGGLVAAAGRLLETLDTARFGPTEPGSGKS